MKLIFNFFLFSILEFFYQPIVLLAKLNTFLIVSEKNNYCDTKDNNIKSVDCLDIIILFKTERKYNTKNRRYNMSPQMNSDITMNEIRVITFFPTQSLRKLITIEELIFTLNKTKIELSN